MLIGFECQKNYAILHRQLAVTSDFSALRAEAILYLGPVVTSKKIGASRKAILYL